MKFPTDIEATSDAWGANCGPCSLAAILQKQVAGVRAFLGPFERMKYMNPTMMKAALTLAGASFRDGPKEWPQYGLVFVQWGGHESKPVTAQYRCTHWIAVDGDLVFEINANEMNRLVTRKEWERTMPSLAHDEKWGNGSYSIRSVILLDKPEARQEPRPTEDKAVQS